MAKESLTVEELQDQLADAQAQIDTLQSAAADAEAHSVTARAELAEAAAARESVQSELTRTRDDLDATRSQLRAAAARYRDVKLASQPELPPEMVPEADSIDEIDASCEGAQRVVNRLREKLDEDRRSARVPAGSPPRRPQDLSGLSPAEKIRLGLEERARG